MAPLIPEVWEQAPADKAIKQATNNAVSFILVVSFLLVWGGRNS